LVPMSITGTPGSLWKWGTTCSAMETPHVAARSAKFGRTIARQARNA
jgi:hypothetical protein